MAILVLFYAVGVFIHIHPFFQPLIKYTTEPLLYITLGFLFYFDFKKGKRTDILWWYLAVFIITLTIEIIGVKSGKIFGQYNYGNTMAMKIYGVPFIIGLNWIFLIRGSYDICSFWIKNKKIIPFFSSAIIVLFDFIMEPVAIKLDYWQWFESKVPVQNYIVWFILSFVFSLGLNKMRFTTKSPILGIYLTIQLLFFLILLFCLT
ncbi:MAG: carotenoid biosynthesis protein [Bacteroidales bacterium]|nr:carotenoid biosynthesis protein [Bacteroidales bacterium]